MKSFLLGFLLLLPALATGKECTCPNSNFVVLRYIDYDNVYDELYKMMDERYQNAVDYFDLTLAGDANPTVDPANDKLKKYKSERCFVGTVTELKLSPPGLKTYTINASVRTAVYKEGGDVELCECKLSSGGDCPDELMAYFRDNAEFRMNDLVVKLTPYYDFVMRK